MEEPAGVVQSLILVCFVLIPAIVALIGVVLLMRAQKVQKTMAQVTGTVVSVRSISQPDEATACCPTFAFEAPDGTRMQAETDGFGPAMRYPVNSTHGIWVDFADPTVVHLSRGSSMTVALACIGVGGGVALVGMYALGSG